VRDFACANCGQRLSFENSLCLGCDSQLGFHFARRDLVVLTHGEEHDGVIVDARDYKLCDNLHLARCNWLVSVDDEDGLCESCALTRTRPNDDDIEALEEFAQAEDAKRRLIFELSVLGLPIVSRETQPDNGLAFDLLSSREQKIFTGHADGVITLDLAEGDDVHREQMRVELAEPYRTLLGHFRHEIGHYYFTVLVGEGESRPEFEELFGDPDLDYQAALDRHYADGAPPGWEDEFVSSYATMHPAEDWAETFAHYLHIRDTLDTAAAFGFAPAGVTLDKARPGRVGFNAILDEWLPLVWSLNMINRSMGHPDLYPFVLAPRVLDKLAFAHQLVTAQQQVEANNGTAV
jgi:hypothetical protein